MSQRMGLDDLDMRTRLRSQRPSMDGAAYAQRSVIRPSRQLFQDISSTLVYPQVPRDDSVSIAPPISIAAPQQPVRIAAKPAVVNGPLQTPEALPIFGSFQQKTLERVPPSPIQAMPVQPATPPVQAHIPRPFELPPASKHEPLFHPRHIEPKRTKVHAPTIFADQLPAKKKFKFGLKLPSRTTMLTGMAIAVFIVGIGVSFIGFRTNNIAHAQAVKLSKAQAIVAPTTTNGAETAPPSTATIGANTIEAYKVAADLPRLIRINKLGVYARVLQVGQTNTGALATPTNVFDTAWYTGSAKPGQPGATLIDGHVSSWTTNGVFYGIKNLVPGDDIDIVKGDNSVLNYTVVKTTAYPVGNVDMKALQTPIIAGKSGLNLITCGGKYDSKAGEFTQRIAVFATLNQ